MSNSSGGIPKYRKHASGQARVTINGRDYLLGPHGTKASKREYDRLVAEYLTGGRSDSFALEAGGLSVAILMADYLRHAKSYYGIDTSSEWHRIKLALRPLNRLYADALAVEFGPSEFRVVRQAMLDSGLTRQGINAHMKRIVRMFKCGCC